MMVEPYAISSGRGRAVKGAKGVKYSSGIVRWSGVVRRGYLGWPALPVSLAADCLIVVEDATLGALVVIGWTVLLPFLSGGTMAWPATMSTLEDGRPFTWRW